MCAYMCVETYLNAFLLQWYFKKLFIVSPKDPYGLSEHIQNERAVHTLHLVYNNVYECNNWISNLGTSSQRRGENTVFKKLSVRPAA